MISTLPLSERPRERCLEAGPSSLSLRECIALILGAGPPGEGCMGLASKIMDLPGKGLGPLDLETAFFSTMESAGSNTLQEIPGLGPSGMAKILSTFEIARRYSVYREQNLKRQNGPVNAPRLSLQALDQIPQRLRSRPQEWLGFVPVYRSGKTGQLCVVENGVRTHVNIDPAELFARILCLRPLGFFLFHNHPCGTPTASPQDLDLTVRIAEISEQLGIRLLGHAIVTPQNEYWIDWFQRNRS